MVRTPEGTDAWLVEGAPLQDVVFALYAGKARDSYAPFKQRYEDSAGTGSPRQRIAEQDVDGVDAEILFPGANGPRFWRHLRDDACYLSFVRAYNEFLAEEYCAEDSARLIGVGAIPWIGVDKLIWATDFPHQESDWPDSRRILELNFEGVPAGEVEMMVSGNVSRLFGLDNAAPA